MTTAPSQPFAFEVALDSDTGYHRRAEASASDDSAGSTITVGVNGPRFGDGSGVSACDVTIVP